MFQFDFCTIACDLIKTSHGLLYISYQRHYRTYCEEKQARFRIRIRVSLKIFSSVRVKLFSISLHRNLLPAPILPELTSPVPSRPENMISSQPTRRWLHTSVRQRLTQGILNEGMVKIKLRVFPTVDAMAKSVLITGKQTVCFYKLRIDSSEREKLVVVCVVFILTPALHLQQVHVCHSVRVCT